MRHKIRGRGIQTLVRVGLLVYSGGMAEQNGQQSVTRMGNPGKPVGDAGVEMLARMNASHGPVTEWGLSHISVPEDAAVLDIGCGGGATLHRLAARAPRGVITGIDYSEVSVACSTDFNRADVESGRMKVLQASVEAMPFADESFDIITTVESFYFWPDQAANLREVHRVLKPGGTFLLIAEIHENGALPESDRENVRTYNLFNPTQEQFLALFRQAGFTQVATHTKPGEQWIAVTGGKGRP